MIHTIEFASMHTMHLNDSERPTRKQDLEEEAFVSMLEIEHYRTQWRAGLEEAGFICDSFTSNLIILEQHVTGVLELLERV